MVTLLAIFQYFIAGAIDITDKFLLSRRKIEPVSYTFWTVATGALLLLAWPWTFAHIPGEFVGWNLLSGAVFSLAMYTFFAALSEGDVSRVIPYVFGLVPVFDVFLGMATGRNRLTLQELAAICLLIPGALLISYNRKNFSRRHILLKTSAALLLSCYYALWQYGAQAGPALNSLMWNRLGAAAVLIALLAVPAYRKKVFRHEQIPRKGQTSFLFLLKQAVGGGNFIFYSWLLTVGKISVINALQGFRYVFLLAAGLVLSRRRRHIMDEEFDPHEVKIRAGALALIFLGCVILFI